jgi:hypothetical protein
MTFKKNKTSSDQKYYERNHKNEWKNNIIN